MDEKGGLRTGPIQHGSREAKTKRGPLRKIQKRFQGFQDVREGQEAVLLPLQEAVARESRRVRPFAGVKVRTGRVHRASDPSWSLLAFSFLRGAQGCDGCWSGGVSERSG